MDKLINTAYKTAVEMQEKSYPKPKKPIDLAYETAVEMQRSDLDFFRDWRVLNQNEIESLLTNQDFKRAVNILRFALTTKNGQNAFREVLYATGGIGHETDPTLKGQFFAHLGTVLGWLLGISLEYEDEDNKEYEEENPDNSEQNIEPV